MTPERQRSEVIWLKCRSMDHAFFHERAPGDWREIRDLYAVAGDAAEEADDLGTAQACVSLHGFWAAKCAGSLPPNEHTHPCPQCHQHVGGCQYTCIAEPDLGESSCGYAVCDECEACAEWRCA